MAFTYDPATLHKAAADLSSGSANIESELAGLTSRISPLEEGFRGEAGTEFQALWAEWHESGKRLKASLEGLSSLLEKAGQNAEQMESANKSMMRK